MIRRMVTKSDIILITNKIAICKRKQLFTKHTISQ